MGRFLLLSLLGAQMATGQFFRGVNLSGSEFGANSLPGEFGHDYTFHSEDTFRYFGDKKLNLFRIAMRWERLQPALGGPLDAAYLNHLKDNIAWARKWGVFVVPQVHNFGRYVISGDPDCPVIPNNVNNQGCIIGSAKVTTAHFADFWVRMSQEFRNEPTVYAYDLMNEPHDMGSSNWNAISQAVVTAIRETGDTKLIMVPGNSYSNATGWQTYNGATSWINDPADNVMYEAHIYFDSDYSGSYNKGHSATTYEEQRRLNPNLDSIAATRITPFIEWCSRNGVRGYVGEYGIPDDDERWKPILEDLLTRLDAAGMYGSYWAAGEWWGNYNLAVQPSDNFRTDRPQMEVLLRHLGASALLSVSAANGFLSAGAPDSLAAGYGKDLVPEGASLGNVELQLSGPHWSRAAQVLYAGSGQINYYIPADTPLGLADVTVRYGGNATAAGTLMVRDVAPGLFEAVQIIRYRADGTESWELASRWDSGLNRVVPVPIDLGPPTDRVFLVLYGTGLRRGAQPVLQLGGASPNVDYWRAQGSFLGVDQVNAEVPRSLAGSGDIAVRVTTEGQASNTITLNIK